ncbi:GTP cyclohydrolase I [Streptomyces sp. NPDC060022]|uniref:GTP cyclohydrolase I n=1 Tax=Streptomyces sp. NPDC060022 TaxID=3347039 RepID=UPI0036BF7DEA
MPHCSQGSRRCAVATENQVERAGVGASTHTCALPNSFGINCEDESTRNAPRRLARVLHRLPNGTGRNPKRHLRITFPSVGEPRLIIATGITFTSVCEHHVLPFSGHATVGCLPSPGAFVIGISKLARIVREYAARPQTQERIGEQVVAALVDCLDVQGAGCVLRASHVCMARPRGARAQGAHVTTEHLRGAFSYDAALRDCLFDAEAVR